MPGGVGPMTVAMLMKNTVIGAQKAAEKLINSAWTLRPLQLKLQTPVPRYLKLYTIYEEYLKIKDRSAVNQKCKVEKIYYLNKLQMLWTLDQTFC